ncbi:SpoIIE family protein phosphatase [Streptomyces sp. NPDC051104]|uniref:SpoIIE family protein phosphatase n=1 Tax=Streptomyces sp. NPDC051104 TaxID=3155044 RepID=UPI003432286B
MSDGTAAFPELTPGPPLGLGGLLFETAELQLPARSRLVFYTDGLLEGHRRDIDVGIETLRRALAVPDRPAEETCEAVLDAMLLPARSSDDVALLVVRTRPPDSQQIASARRHSPAQRLIATRHRRRRRSAHPLRGGPRSFPGLHRPRRSGFPHVSRRVAASGICCVYVRTP